MEREVKKNRVDWEKTIKEAKVLIGLQCPLGGGGIRRRRRRRRRRNIYK